jgi:hypothetical protein
MKLSKIASLFLAGGIAIGMITGCGNDSNSNRNNVGIHASDAYVIAFDNGAPSTLVPVNCNGTITNVAARIAGAKGYITLPSNARGCIVTLNTAYVDIDLNGEFNASVDKIMAMPLKTKVNQGKFANPITTYAIDKGDNALLNEASDFDPVQGYVEAVNGDTKAKNLVLVTEVIKTVAKVAGASSLTELNITSSDINNTNTILACNQPIPSAIGKYANQSQIPVPIANIIIIVIKPYNFFAIIAKRSTSCPASFPSTKCTKILGK